MTHRHFFNIELTEGSDYSESFVYADPSTTLPISLTDYSADMKIRIAMNGNYNAYANPDFVLELSTTTGEIVLGGDAGTVTVNISGDKTTGLNWNRGAYTLFLISPSGGRAKFIEGFITINGSTL
jgi:hypothetical protein